MGRVHSIQSLGTVDGPGVRCVVFMQGCPLRCGYCHNPDTWDLAGGEALSADEVFRRVKRLQPYFKNGGGLTVSGGEPLLQEAFTAELFSRCREAGIHTCLDTSGCIFTKDTEALLAVTDLVLLDIKMTTDEEYREYIGCPMAGPLRFWDELEKRGCLKETTRVLATHFSHNAGLLHQGLSQAGAQYGIEVAYDGLIWEKT